MPNLKPYTLVIAGGIAGLLMATTNAHIDKGYDRNGGHYDPFGDYHCHQAGCRMAPSRWDRMNRNRSLSDQNGDLFYNDDDWPYWTTTGGCQTVRTQVFVATSDVPVTYTNPRQCEVREGHWVDPYTGDEYGRAARMEIDHIISPVYANASNGYMWDDNKRASFANDPINLIPVGRSIHAKKRDRGIGSWRPPAEDFHCDYAAAWRDVSERYDLDLFARDRSRMVAILKECGLPERSLEGNDTETDTDVRVNGIPIPL